jgi:hypothetical protein
MKRARLAILILMIPFILLIGCSREKPSTKAVQKTVVKEPITLPVEKENAGQAQTPDTAPPLPATGKTNETKPSGEQEKGVYTTKGDESLAAIAARQDVYGDSLKWILLYRFNRGVFEKMEKDASFPNKPVPAGAKLKIASPAGSKTVSGSHWAVNVLSFPEQEEIVRDAVNLVDSGYPAYIIKANVKGVDYLRLRVGFFKEKTAAESEGQKIMTLLNVSGVWTTKTEETEFKEFGGYE